MHLKVGERVTVALGQNTKLMDIWSLHTPVKLTIVMDYADSTPPRPPTMRGADQTHIWVLEPQTAGRCAFEATCFGKGEPAAELEDFTLTLVVS